MALSFFFGQAAEPAASRIVRTVTTKHLVDLVNETQGHLKVMVVTQATVKTQEIAYRKCIRPKVAARRSRARDARRAGEIIHQFSCKRGIHFAF